MERPVNFSKRLERYLVNLYKRTPQENLRIYTESKKFMAEHPDKLKIHVAMRFGLSIWSLNDIIRKFEPLNKVGRPPGVGTTCLYPWEI